MGEYVDGRGAAISERTRRKDRDKADNTIGMLWVVGLLALVAGVITAVVSAPGTETSFGTTVETGSQGAFVLGLIAAAVGQTMVLVGMVASGVALGIRSTRQT